MGIKNKNEKHYCKRNFVEIEEFENGKTICDNCDVRCIHSTNKDEKDYMIVKKIDKRK